MNLTCARDMMKTGATAFTLPPGQYYLGDPCYVLDDETYRSHWGRQRGYAQGCYIVNGGLFAVGSTYQGDGRYEGSNGAQYGVDSGCLALVSMSLVQDVAKALRGGTVHTFDEPVLLDRSEWATFTVSSGCLRFEVPTTTDEDVDACAQFLLKCWRSGEGGGL
jgi:hypothetical protein